MAENQVITLSLRLLDPGLLDETLLTYEAAVENEDMTPEEAEENFNVLVEGMAVIEYEEDNGR